jgi:hypothetical protein
MNNHPPTAKFPHGDVVHLAVPHPLAPGGLIMACGTTSTAKTKNQPVLCVGPVTCTYCQVS